MSSLIVLLPSIGAFDAAQWQAVPMPYALFDRRAHPVCAGDAPRDAWPKAAEIVLVLSARDTLLVDVPLPPVTGVKLRRSLPHVVEEYLVDDPQHSHVAVGPVVANDAPSTVAVVDRARFGAVIDWFVAAGWRRIRAVPLVHCMPPVVVAEADEATESAGAEAPDSDAEALATAGGEADVLIVGRSASAASDGDAGAQWLELAVKHGASGFGIETHVAALDVAIAELSKRQPVRVHALTLGTRDGGADIAAHSAFPLAARTLSWEALARSARDCPFDLCQFEFANGARAAGGGGSRRWWPAAGLVIASLVVAIVAVNLQWWQLRHRQDVLNAQMTALVKDALPGTTVLLDPRAQLQAGLERLRGAAGELRANDYLVLAAALSRALGSIPSDAIATLDYRDGVLTVAFAPGAAVDGEGLRRRLQAQGLSVQEENAKWMLGSARPAPH